MLGQTRDDAAGEALDKAARLLGLGYPGAPRSIGWLGLETGGVRLPSGCGAAGRSLLQWGSNGICVRGKGPGPRQAAERTADLAASFQRAVVETLLRDWRWRSTRLRSRLAVGGGVAANSELRNAWGFSARTWDRIEDPAPELCTDNAAMIASARPPGLACIRGLSFDAFARAV